MSVSNQNIGMPGKKFALILFCSKTVKLTKRLSLKTANLKKWLSLKYIFIYFQLAWKTNATFSDYIFTASCWKLIVIFDFNLTPGYGQWKPGHTFSFLWQVRQHNLYTFQRKHEYRPPMFGWCDKVCTTKVSFKYFYIFLTAIIK